MKIDRILAHPELTISVNSIVTTYLLPFLPWKQFLPENSFHRGRCIGVVVEKKEFFVVDCEQFDIKVS